MDAWPPIMEVSMKSLMWLVSSVLNDISMQCNTDTQRDHDYVKARVEREGLSFLTITLSNFARDFERSLEEGLIDSTRFLGFKRRASLPAFLQGLISRVFDIGDGKLLKEPDIAAIFFVRQFCLMWKKVNIDCSKERTEDAIKAYIETDEDINRRPAYDTVASNDEFTLAGEVGRVGRFIWHRLEYSYANAWRYSRLVPKHGPGATAERISGNQKFELRTWHARLQEHFPLDSYAFPNASWLGEECSESIDILEPGAEPPVRVVTVPKTQKGPRVIAIEPVCMQYTQQAIAEFLVREIEQGTLTSGRINFRDQTVNRALALDGSKSGYFATIDLSEASDRVSLSLVRLVFKSCPLLMEALEATRTTSAELPDGTKRPVYKFASMGSALCFPVEAGVFFTLAVVGRCKALNLPLTYRNVVRMSRQVYVYGDDIIVPASEVLTVIETLEAFGLKVNRNKSFWIGKFRESCGMDAYAGEPITPVYLRELPDHRRSRNGIVSLVSFANQLYKIGLWRTARDVRRYVEGLVGPLPHVLETSPGVGWHSFLGSYVGQRWCPKTHAFLVKAWVVKPIEYPDPLQGHGALLKFFLKRGSKLAHFGEKSPGCVDWKSPDRSNLTKSVRPGGVYIKRQWVRPY